MKVIETKGIYYLEAVHPSSNWYVGEESWSGDLYEAEELFRANKPFKKNRLVFVRFPEGDVMEPMELEEGQYFGRPTLYQDGKQHLVMVDFPKQEIHLLAFDLDKLLEGGAVETLEILPLSCVEDCYNLLLRGTPAILTRESSDQYFQIIWSAEEGRMQVGFQMEDRENFSHMEGNKLYFTSWWEEEAPFYEYHEEVIVRNREGEMLERYEGTIQEINPGEYYILR